MLPAYRFGCFIRRLHRLVIGLTKSLRSVVVSSLNRIGFRATHVVCHPVHFCGSVLP